VEISSRRQEEESAQNPPYICGDIPAVSFDKIFGCELFGVPCLKLFKALNG
jgi:hypothetical protein